MKRYINILTISLLSAVAAIAQPKYVSPVDFPILLAGNVGELRTNAFHAGIDIKGMKGVGSPVFAIADGYVMRVGVSAWGYGNVIYVKHKDGAISVYGHLHEFAPRIAEWVRAQQYSKKSFTVDLYPTATQFPVKQGEKIATVGNSGSSGGAHVHLEIRDPRTGLPMNLINEGFYKVADHEKPVLKSVKLFEIDTIEGLEIHRLKASIVPPAPMNFKLRGNGYIAYEVVDYKDGKSNTMGVYSIDQKVNGVTNYGFAMDRTDYAKGRYVNAHTAYSEHIATKFDVIRAYVSPANMLGIYKNVQNRGVISASETPVNVETVITDDAGNKTIVNITIEKDETPYTAIAPENKKAVKHNRDFAYTTPNLVVNIPNGSLYDDVFMEFGESDGIYTIGSPDVPLHKAYWATVAAPGVANPAKSGVVIVSGEGKMSWIGGNYANGRVSFSTNRFGNFKVMADTIPPVITPQQLAVKGSNLLKFKLSDNLSGVAHYVLTIDGAWALAEYDGKTSTLSHKIRRNQTPLNHNVVLVVTDSKGNSTTFKQAVKW